ncbi:MAG: hypothetical protein E4H36_00880 [Spirochaetales bacterium]|nr:MAG: hypothetical protein E4H36_00880 [Spirochaetales bacterium]
MKKLHLLLGILLLVLVLGGGLYAQDFGITLDNATSIDFEPAAVFGQWDKLSLWFNTGTQNKTVFSMKGSYTFSLESYYLFDIDHLNLKGTYPVSGAKTPREFSFTLGRYYLSDFTGYVLSHTLDGIQIGVSYPFADISASFGYTGLLMKPNSSIVLSRLDYTDLLDNAILTAPPRLVGQVALTFPNLVLNQTLNLTFLFQNDIDRVMPERNTYLSEGETVFDPTLGGLINTQYMGLGLSGPIASTLFYDLFFYMNTGRLLTWDTAAGMYGYVPVIAFTTGGGFRYYSEQLLYSRFQLGFLFSSGDTDSPVYVEGNTAGNSDMFIPISSSATGLVFSPRLGNLMYGTLQYSLKPLSMLKGNLAQQLSAGVNWYLFLRPTDGAISEAGFLPASTEKYLGTELDMYVKFRPFSDLGASLSGGFFVPSAGFEDTSARGLLKLDFSMSF